MSFPSLKILKVCFWKCDFGRKNGNEWREWDLNNNYLREIQIYFIPINEMTSITTDPNSDSIVYELP